MVLFANRYQKAKPEAKCGCSYWLFCFYLVKNCCQFGLAVAALGLAIDLNWGHDYISAIQKSFNCSIVNDGINFWPGVDTVPCLYNSAALNEIFIIFYVIILLCLIVASFVGCFRFMINDIYPPEDKNIVNFPLDDESKPQGKVITGVIRGSKIEFMVQEELNK